jgi:hypothetical protein
MGNNNNTVAISDHAIVRYLERKNDPRLLQAKHEIKAIVESGVEVKPSDSLRRLLRHGIKETRYFLRKKSIVVVRDGLAITVLDAKKDQNEWRPLDKSLYGQGFWGMPPKKKK